jgi:hypothetical protein
MPDGFVCGLRELLGDDLGVSTDEVHSKLRAAEWEITRLPDEHKPDPPEDVDPYIAYVQNAIRMASTYSSPRR